MTAASKKPIEQFDRAIDASYRPSTANADSLTVEVSMSSETPYLRRTWRDGMFHEVLSHDPAHVRLDKMANGAPVLDNHNRYGSVDDTVIGVVESVRIDSSTKQMVGVVRFDKGEKGRSIFRKVADGIIRKFSIGYTVFDYTDTVVEDQVTTRTVVDWQPYEVSAVAVPADDNASSRSKDQNFNNPQNSVMKEEIVTPGTEPNEATPAATTPAATEQNRAAAPAAATPNAPSAAVIDAAVTRALAEDRRRADAIRLNVRSAGFDNAYAAELINDGLTELQASRAITAKWAKENPEAINGSVDTVTINGGDESRAIIDGMAGTLMRRAGMAEGEMTDAERRYENMDMADMCRSILEHRNESTTGLTRLQIVKRAFTRSGFHSSTDFPIIFGNVINRSLQRAYAYQARTFLAWTSSTTHSDFRVVEKAKLSSLVGALDRIPEGGEYKAGTFTESKEGYAVHKYGTLITYTYEMAVNDDLGFLKRVPAAFALSAAQRQSDLVYAILTGNPLMNDGLPLFDAAHGNLGTPAALSDASLTEADQMFMNQTDSTGKFINVSPKYLIVGTANKHLAKKLMASVSPNNTNDVNIHAGAYEVIVEPRLGNAWFLAADPNAIDTIEYATLAGHPELFTESTENFNIDGTQIKARMIFGVKALDWRGLFMNAGA